MSQLDIKPTHKPIKQYYDALDEFKRQGVVKETSVRAAFQEILTTYARKRKWSFIAEYGIPLTKGTRGSVDGAILAWDVPLAYWEAKDSSDDLRKEIGKKFAAGYPASNILFQQPKLAILIQDNAEVNEYDLTDPARLVACLEDFFSYRAEEEANWEEIVGQFKDRIPESAGKLIEMIEVEKKSNTRFKSAFQTFADLCRASINPNLADTAIEEMLVQHMLTSRIFETVFNNPEFVRRNVIASEIEKVIDALTSRSFNRHQFFTPLDHFYKALEARAQSITDWSQKQSFLNTVYEKFFQGFAVKVADTHGIVYTPQPIVDFMVRSVQHILKTEFKRSLADEGVHILDPFVGTGNFIMRIMKEIAQTQKTKLPKKYAKELHCNEVMLLPYYIASMNIEHEYYTQTGEYKPFDGICLVDTFELAEPAQTALFSTENSARVECQKKSPIFVIIGNPPYNAGQVNENDNNKNRKYPVIDKRVNETYSKDSKASNKNDLIDPYIKAFRWASDRIGKNGVIAFVSNNNFLDGIAFDGVRANLAKDFNRVYVIDLKGNVRRDSMKDGIPIGEEHTVFGLGAMVGISIILLVKNPLLSDVKIEYHGVPFRMKRKEKFEFLRVAGAVQGVEMEEVIPRKNVWLNEGMEEDFDSLIPLGTKDAKQGNEHSIFGLYCLGNTTNRDTWAVNYQKDLLASNMSSMSEVYNQTVRSYAALRQKPAVDDFVSNDDHKISWSRDLKADLMRGKEAEFDEQKIRKYAYRPFANQFVFFDRILNEEVRRWPSFLPLSVSDGENSFICVSAIGNPKPFHTLMTDCLTDLHLTADSQCFPFYTYDEDGSHRRENITDWALGEFRERMKDEGGRMKEGKGKGKEEGERMKDEGGGMKEGKGKGKVEGGGMKDEGKKGKEKKPSSFSLHPSSLLTKWDIFYYVYGLLHHPEYRTKYAANLRRELPRIPISPDFWAFSEAGKKLADLHVGYESVKEYPLEQVWRPGAGLNLRVEKMKLKKPTMTPSENAVIARNPGGVTKQSVGVTADDKGLLRRPKGTPRNDGSTGMASIVYNADLTLTGIPPEAFEYRLGNRSAIDWIIDQYQVSTDKRSGITNDPNREDDKMYIVELIGKVVTVSLETVRIVGEIRKLALG